jgi:hypothetical protein
MEGALVADLDLGEIERVVAKLYAAAHRQAVDAVAVALEADGGELVDAPLGSPEKQGAKRIEVRDPPRGVFAKVVPPGDSRSE